MARAVLGACSEHAPSNLQILHCHRANAQASGALLAHGLKLGEITGGVALFVDPGTNGYFKDLPITPN